MFSVVILTLLILIMLLIIGGLFLSVWREHRRHRQVLVSQTDIPPHRFDSHVTAILHLHEGNIVRVEPFKSSPGLTLPSSWYTRRRSLVSIGFLLMVILTLFVQDGLAGGGGTLRHITKGLGLNFLSYEKAIDVHPTSHGPVETASKRLIRVNSGDRNQYHTDYQYNVWSWSSCSGIAMEMVMNSYGQHVIAADVLQVEADMGVWNTQLGLLREDGISMTAAHFGFNTEAGHSRNLDDVIASANNGTPVIVSMRDAYYFPGGHLLVVRGGDDQYVYLADSSSANFQRMTRGMFLGMWQGFSAILTPRE